MATAVSSLPGPTGGTVQPIRTRRLWGGIGRLLACFALTLVLSLVISPGEAQAHGLHGSSAPIAQTIEEDSLPQAALSDADEISASDCTTCCTLSGCLVTNLVAYDFPPADKPRSAYQPASIVVVYQTHPNGLLRPPKHSS